MTTTGFSPRLMTPHTTTELEMNRTSERGAKAVEELQAEPANCKQYVCTLSFANESQRQAGKRLVA